MITKAFALNDIFNQMIIITNKVLSDRREKALERDDLQKENTELIIPNSQMMACTNALSFMITERHQVVEKLK